MHDAVLRGGIQPGVHGQAHDLLRHGIAHGQLGMRVGHGGLLVERCGVVHGGGDACGLQLRLHLAAVWHLHGVLGPGAGVVRFDMGRGGNACLVQQGVVALGHLLAQGQFFVEDSQLGQQDGCLQGVEPAVDAHVDMVVAAVLAVAGDLAHDFGQFVVVGKEGTAVAIATQGLAGEEAGAGDRRQIAAFAAFVGGAKALGGVFNHRNAVAGGNGVDGVIVGTLAIQADGDDGLGSRGDGGFEQGGVEVVAAWAHIYIHGFGAQQGHGFGGGNVGKAGGDDFVARAYAQRHLGNLQGVCAVGHGDAVFGAGVFAQLFFQLGHFGAEDVLAVVQYALDASVNVCLQALVLAFEVDEVHGFSGKGLTQAFWQGSCRSARNVHRCGGRCFRQRLAGATPAVRQTRSSSQSGGRVRPP